MALSGMIAFGLLVLFTDCLNGQITYPNPVIIRSSSKTRTALMKCQVNSATYASSALHWYRLKDQAFKRLMYFEAGSKTAVKEPDASPKIFSSVKDADKNKQVELTLTIPKPDLGDAGIYYCTYWSEDRKVFGSGTRLYVTEPGKDKFTAPTLSGYLPSKKDKNKKDKNGKQTMLCHASGMFPDLVRFEWKKKDADQWTAVSEGDVVEQRNEKPEVTVTSMLIVDKDKAQNDNYKCTVIHEGNTDGTKSLEMKEESSEPAQNPEQNAITPCPTSTEVPKEMQKSGDSEQMPSMFLFIYAYRVLLLKNALFFCVVSIFLLKRKAARKDKSSET
ncbi:immunoglobulin kappa light chain-like isoform X1 [Puntigrus tetrazona]|uniref:immunoglobulin kappa light chain-like isoform X1 n=1 Tax=Puntigrus tetrazona TaxID=1606681 RepID=UPI001C8A2C2E|nr:immunoglobulin kappa light chain-like isoform X1 [Puntigrus tetrazona]